METKTRSKTLLVIAALLFASLACSIGGLTIQDNKATLEVKIKDDQIMTLFERVATQSGYDGGEILEYLDHVDLHEGYVSVYGSYPGSDGNAVSGSLDVSLGAQNGVLQAEITSMNIPGTTVDEARIQEINQRIAQEITRFVTESNGDVSFQNVEVHEDALYLTVQVEMQNSN